MSIHQNQDIHLAADRYDGLHATVDSDGEGVNLKQASGCRKRRNECSKEYEIRKGLKLKHFDQIVRNKASKANLQAFLFEIWSESVDILSMNSKLYLSGGYKDRLHMNVISRDAVDVSDDERVLLSSTHEEADTRVFLHATVAIKGGCNRIVIWASDTDIVVIALYLYRKLYGIGLREMYLKSKSHFIPVHILAEHLSDSEREMLPLIHALSGCDTNGFVYGKGKRIFMKAVLGSETVSEIAQLCSSMQCDISEETVVKTVAIATDLLVHLYVKDDFNNLNAVRAHLYYGGTRSLECIPPTDDAFKQHVLRAMFQTHTWITADEPVPQALDPFMYGWASICGTTQPVLMLKSPVPPKLNRDNFCKCRKKCTRNCLCKKLNVRCEVSCLCRGQANTCVRSQFQLEMD